MKDTRRIRLVKLLASPRFNGDRAAFLAASGMTKGRLTQLLDESLPFGDVAAKNLCKKLELPDGWFDIKERSNQSKDMNRRLDAIESLLMAMPESSREKAYLDVVQLLIQLLPKNQQKANDPPEPPAR